MFQATKKLKYVKFKSIPYQDMFHAQSSMKDVTLVSVELSGELMQEVHPI